MLILQGFLQSMSLLQSRTLRIAAALLFVTAGGTAAHFKILDYEFTATDTLTLIETSRVRSFADLGRSPRFPSAWITPFGSSIPRAII